MITLVAHHAVKDYHTWISGAIHRSPGHFEGNHFVGLGIPDSTPG